jgi:hypothetical protein
MIDLLDRMITDAKTRASRAQLVREAAPLSPRAAGCGPSGEGEGGKSGTSLPRSLILQTTETFCTNCGARYRAPGYAILAEYAFNEVSICRTMDDVRRQERDYQRVLIEQGQATHQFCPRLPREYRTLTVHAPACEACF